MSKREKRRHPDVCQVCGFPFPCQCPKGGGTGNDESQDKDDSQSADKRVSIESENKGSIATHSDYNFSAVEIIVGNNPNLPPLPKGQRPTHENLRLKERFKQYLSIGVYKEGSELKYYLFKNREQKSVKTYSNLIELSEELPEKLKDLFQNQPKLFLIGHAHGGLYGLSGDHFSEGDTHISEKIYGDDFDGILRDFKEALPDHAEILVTLEGCNVANRQQAEGKKSFLERLSEKHKDITFSGSGPWNPAQPETGYRASGGYPKLNLPITAMVGSVWKNNGNRVIFYHEDREAGVSRQAVVSKSMLATTNTAKKLKTNTIKYAIEILKDHEAKEAMLPIICESHDISRIKDLRDSEKVPGFPRESSHENKTIIELEDNEERILADEKIRYISRVKEVVERSERNEETGSKDLLIIALGLKDPRIFEGHEDLYSNLLAKKELLKLVMVESGKVLIAGPDNNKIIDLLLSHVDINSFDKDGMTALHYAAHLFYVYREEPLNLIEKLLESKANIDVKDKQGRTPLMLASAFGHIKVVETLLAKGASKDVTDIQGRTASMLAKQNGHNDIVQLLQSDYSAASIVSQSPWSADTKKQDDQNDYHNNIVQSLQSNYSAASTSIVSRSCFWAGAKSLTEAGAKSTTEAEAKSTTENESVVTLSDFQI